MDLNSVSLTGRLGQDPELRYTQGEGVAVANFNLAVGRMKKDETDWFTIVCWRKTAEFIAEYAGKGDRVAVKGELRAESYEDKEGIKRKVVKVVAQTVVLLESRNQKNSDHQENSDIKDEDVPF